MKSTMTYSSQEVKLLETSLNCFWGFFPPLLPLVSEPPRSSMVSVQSLLISASESLHLLSVLLLVCPTHLTPFILFRSLLKHQRCIDYSLNFYFIIFSLFPVSVSPSLSLSVFHSPTLPPTHTHKLHFYFLFLSSSGKFMRSESVSLTKYAVFVIGFNTRSKPNCETNEQISPEKGKLLFQIAKSS